MATLVVYFLLLEQYFVKNNRGTSLIGDVVISYECLFLGGGAGALKPPVGRGLLVHEVSRSHTTTHHSR